jgi:(2Fe-2S) ferredoxin
MNDDMPQTTAYARHIFICTGRYCDPTGKARQLYRQLAVLLGDLGIYNNPHRVKRGETPCLGVCIGGPIVVIYPDGVWYHHVDEALLKRIVDEHLRQNKPVNEQIFYRLDADPQTNGIDE